MELNKKEILGTRLLMGGTIVNLALEIYWIFLNSEVVTWSFRIVSAIFGTWFATILVPATYQGYYMPFSIKQLIWVPDCIVVFVFLLVISYRIIFSKVNQIIFHLLTVLGIWNLIQIVYRIFNLKAAYNGSLKGILSMLSGDLVIIAMTVGIILLVLENSKKDHSSNEVSDLESTNNTMSFWNGLFSFKGRINRARYWMYLIPLNLIWIFGVIVDVSTVGKLGGWYLITTIITLWPSLAISIKRCHDRNKSGWFVLVAIVPLLNLWYVVEIGFLAGTIGDNRFGPDPLRIK